MSRNQPRQHFDAARAIKKLFLSCFVVFSFVAYVVHERLVGSDSAVNPAPTLTTVGAVSARSTPFASVIGAPPPPNADFSQPSPVPTATTQAPSVSSTYKDGSYQGPAVDAYYGLVQVQVDIQGGAIKDVQFLQYPSDRRTSQEINSIAMPYLQQEAVQAQSARVDIISGATLTSEGFMASLQSALQGAHN
jgi:uncharacterized protein with FMN-binding domain